MKRKCVRLCVLFLDVMYVCMYVCMYVWSANCPLSCIGIFYLQNNEVINEDIIY